MTDAGEVARHPMLPLRRGMATGSGVWGLGSLVVAMIAGELPPVLVLALTAMLAAFWGLAMWWTMRSRMEEMYDEAERADGPHDGDRRTPFVLGLLVSCLLLLVLLVVMWVMALLFQSSDSQDEAAVFTHFVPGFLLGSCLWLALEVRDLRRWQDESGLEIFSRVGGRHVAWTSRQAQGRLVAVVQRSPAVAVTTEP